MKKMRNICLSGVIKAYEKQMLQFFCVTCLEFESSWYAFLVHGHVTFFICMYARWFMLPDKSGCILCRSIQCFSRIKIEKKLTTKYNVL